MKHKIVDETINRLAIMDFHPEFFEEFNEGRINVLSERAAKYQMKNRNNAKKTREKNKSLIGKEKDFMIKYQAL